MIPSLNDVTQDFVNLFQENSKKDICIQGDFGTNNILLLSEILKHEFFDNKKILSIEPLAKKGIKKILNKNTNISFDAIFIQSEIYNPFEWEEILNEKNITGRKIFFGVICFEDEKTEIFNIPNLSFREYIEEKYQPFSIQKILKGEEDLEHLEILASQYLQNGAFLQNIDGSDHIFTDFSKKITIMSEELFEKEKEDFAEFIRTIAMNIGGLFKEDSIAKNLNLSRRKVRKFTDLLIKYDIIRFMPPFVRDSEIELTRHNKIYFSDLSYYHGALGVAYGLGNGKIGMIENFIFLELSRKLDNTHELYFWRKKSGTEISFVLQNQETSQLTAIDVNLTHSDNILKTMKSFYDLYADDIEHGMSLRENTVKMSTFHEKPFFILPYYAI